MTPVAVYSSPRAVRQYAASVDYGRLKLCSLVACLPNHMAQYQMTASSSLNSLHIQLPSDSFSYPLSS
jgi:hypothetical protein